MLLPEHRAILPEWPTWESKRIQSMNDKLTKKDFLIYVGAEEGDIAGLVSQWVGKIALVEPDDKVWPNIKSIWEANHLKTPYTINGFCSDKTTVDDVFSHINVGFPDCAGGEVIVDHGFKELKSAGDILQIKIDSIAKGLNITAITLDVEGSEWCVLKGAEQTLRNNKPKIWLSLHPEFMFDQYGEYSGDLRNWIKDIGYKEYLLDYQHEVHLYYE